MFFLEQKEPKTRQAKREKLTKEILLDTLACAELVIPLRYIPQTVLRAQRIQQYFFNQFSLGLADPASGLSDRLGPVNPRAT